MAVHEPTTPAKPEANGFEQRELPAPAEQKLLPAPRKRSWRGLIWLLVLALAGYLGYRYYQGRQEAQAAAARQQAQRAATRSAVVAGVAARRGDLPVLLRGLGTVTAYNTVNIKSRVDGPIVAVRFQEGQNVKQGDVLVEIDPRPYQVLLQQAQGNLARDEAQLKDAQTNLARYQALWQAQVIAKQQLDTQASQVGQFEGVIAVDRANISNAELNLSFTKIMAPISGRIGLRQVDIGNMVHAGDANPLAVITQDRPISVLFTIPADNLPPVQAKLRAGAKMPVEAYDRDDRNRLATGTLETPDNQIDPTTGTARLKSIFPNENGVLFPQQFVNCRLLLETRHNVVLIPAAAVQRGPQGQYVYVAQDGTAKMRPVTTGLAEGSDTEVTSGLAAGEVVITDGQDKLQEGSRVEIRQPGTGGGQNAASGANTNSVNASGSTGAGTQQNGATGAGRQQNGAAGAGGQQKGASGTGRGRRGQ